MHFVILMHMLDMPDDVALPFAPVLAVETFVARLQPALVAQMPTQNVIVGKVARTIGTGVATVDVARALPAIGQQQTRYGDLEVLEICGQK